MCCCFKFRYGERIEVFKSRSTWCVKFFFQQIGQYIVTWKREDRQSVEMRQIFSLGRYLCEGKCFFVDACKKVCIQE